MSDESKNKQKGPKRDKRGHFLKGTSGNPGGVPAPYLELRPLIDQNRYLVTKCIHNTSKLSLTELTEVLANREATAIEAVVARMYSKAISGSLPHAAALLDRLIGAVPRNLVTQDADGETKPMTIQVNTDKLLAVMMQLNQLPEDEKCDLIPDITNG